jgi:predicted RNA-binding protein with PUA-like domain
MSYWLLKSEPEVFGIEHLAGRPKRTSTWDGVRNYQVRNMLRDDFKVGDLGFFYHSSCAVPGIAAVVEVVRAGYPDASAFDRKNQYFDADSKPDAPRWYAVDVRLKQRLKRIITLDELRAHGTRELDGLLLLRRGNRLSITPVNAAHWRFILSLE